MNFRLMTSIFLALFSLQCATSSIGASPVTSESPASESPKKEAAATDKSHKADLHKIEVKSDSNLLKKSDLKLSEKEQKGWSVIKSALDKYQASPGVTAKVEKSLHMSLLDKEKASQGQFYLSKGLFRLNLIQPEASSVVMDGDYIWVVNHFGDLVQVSKMNANKLRKSSALLAVLFDFEEVIQKFDLKDFETRDERFAAILMPKKGIDAGVSKLTMTVDLKNNSVDQVTYWDEIENKTRYTFSDIKFDAKLAKDQFSYTPPKGADVTEY